jgi:hypothetical protein
MIYYDDEFSRNRQLIEDISRYLRGVRLSIHEAQALMDHILRAMSNTDANILLEDIYEFLDGRLGRRRNENERSLRQISERPVYRMTPEEEYQKRLIELQLEITKKELRVKELEHQARQINNDFLSEEECKIE